MSFRDDALVLIEELERYESVSRAATARVVGLAPMSDIEEELSLERHLERGDLVGDEYRSFLRKYLDATTRLHDPRSLAHQVAVPHYSGALAAFLGAYTNNPMAIFEMGPAAVTIECFLVNWLLKKVGWDPSAYRGNQELAETHGGGVLTHGGSLANLTALIAARSKILPNAWEDGTPNNLVILAPNDCHYSISRAAGILGIGSKAIVPLDVEADGTILPERLGSTLEAVKGAGQSVLCVVANAGTTAVGQFDRLRPIGTWCRENGLWLHVDGAHGTSALLSPKHRELLDGIELADSLVWDAHKLMRTPGLCTAVLVRDCRTLDAAFHQDASYLFHDKSQPGIDLVHRTVECTKSGLGLKLFGALAAMGERGIAEYVEQQFALAKLAYSFLAELSDFECALVPQCNIVCFRVHGSDDLQLRIRDVLIAKGSYHLSTATFNGRRFLRMVLTNPATDFDHIKELVGCIRATSVELQAPR